MSLRISILPQSPANCKRFVPLFSGSTIDFSHENTLHKAFATDNPRKTTLHAGVPRVCTFDVFSPYIVCEERVTSGTNGGAQKMQAVFYMPEQTTPSRPAHQLGVFVVSCPTGAPAPHGRSGKNRKRKRKRRRAP